TDPPAHLLADEVEAWETGTPAGRRDAFRRVRALLSALGLASGAGSEELAREIARRTRRKPQEEALGAILRELPEEKGGSPGVLKEAIRVLLERGNDGTVALLTATSSPAGVDLTLEIAKRGLLLDALGRRDAGDALGRLERLLSGRAVRAGDRGMETEDYWPVRFLGMLADEVRRMLLIRARLEETGGGSDAPQNFNAFKARMLPLLE